VIESEQLAGGDTYTSQSIHNLVIDHHALHILVMDRRQNDARKASSST